MPRVFADFDGSWDSHENVRQEAEAIITGNSWQNASDIYDQEGPLSVPIFFNPVEDKKNNEAKIILHKADIINKCKVDVFYEDVAVEASQLRLLCPNCTIKLVPNKK